MKVKSKRQLFLITLGFFFVLLIISSNNYGNNSINNNKETYLSLEPKLSINSKWYPPELISTESTDISETPDIVVDRKGNIHVVWEDITDNYLGSGSGPGAIDITPVILPYLNSSLSYFLFL